MNYLQKKKLAFMSIVNQIKGFVRTVTGIPPLTLPDCVDADSIINYTIDGNSIQDGTPTPENPVEVESVGEFTKNLLPLKEGLNFTIKSMKYSVKNGKFTVSGTCVEVYASNVAFKNNFSFTIKAGTYTFSYTGNNVGTVAIKNADTDETISSLNNNQKSTITFDNETNVYVGMYSYLFDSNIELECEIQLEEGSTATEYEPYGKYKIPVKCSGKNLFDKDGFCAYYNSFGNSTLKANANDNYLGEDCFSYYAKFPSSSQGDFTWLKGAFKENTQYTISSYASFEFNNLESRGIVIIAIKYTDGTITSITKTLYRDSFTKWTTISDANKTIDCLYIQNFASTCKVYLKDFQIEEGTTATDYKPYVEPITTNIYLDEPLRRVGEYADYVDFENGCVSRVIHEKSLIGDGTEVWTQWAASITDSTSGVYYRNAEELGTYANQKILAVVGYSNYFATTAYSLATQDDSKLGMCCFSGKANPPNIGFKIPFTDLNSWKEWLANKHTSGQSLKVYWVWNEAKQIPIILPKLPTIKGTTIYSIDTAIQPSNMSATYYSTAKE